METTPEVHYCDRCEVARALHVATLPSGLTLAFCGHDYTVAKDALKAQGATVVDLVVASVPEKVPA